MMHGSRGRGLLMARHDSSNHVYSQMRGRCAEVNVLKATLLQYLPRGRSAIDKDS